MTGKKTPGGDIIALLSLLAVMDAMKQPEASASGIGIRTKSEDAGEETEPKINVFKNDSLGKLMEDLLGRGPTCGDPDCEACAEVDRRRAAKAGAPGGANTAQVRAVTEVDGQVAALAGLTPAMLEDEPDAPATRMRMATAEFITALRTSYAGKLETSPAHRTIGASVELSLMNALDTALAGLDD